MNSDISKKIDENTFPFVDAIKNKDEVNEQLTKFPIELEPDLIENKQIGQPPAAQPNDESILLNNENLKKLQYEQINNQQGLNFCLKLFYKKIFFS